MKDFIVLIAMIILGVAIAVMIIGDDEDSLKSASGNFMQRQAEALGSE